MAHPLDGVQAKIDRSLEHLDCLVKEVGVFLHSEEPDPPYTTEAKVVDDWRIAHFGILREPPTKLGAIAGDYAQNLRAALDHLVYQLAKLTTDRPGGTQFPIAKSEREYLEPPKRGGPSMRDRYLGCLRPEHRAMIDEVQPYRDRTPLEAELMPLSILNRFSNTDKHRLIHAAFGQMHGVRYEVIGGTANVELVPPDPLPVLIEGAEVYRFRVSDVSGPDVKVNVSIDFSMVFGSLMLDDGDFRNIHRDVVGIIDRFRPIFV